MLKAICVPEFTVGLHVPFTSRVRLQQRVEVADGAGNDHRVIDLVDAHRGAPGLLILHHQVLETVQEHLLLPVVRVLGIEHALTG